MIRAGKNTADIGQHLDEYRKIIPTGERECVWAEAGVVPYKLCDGLFDCQNCAFDMVMRGGEVVVANRLRSKGGKISPHRFYHRGHTWARVEEKACVRIGLDDFGQNLLGRLEEISLPIKEEKLSRKNIRVKGRGSVFALTPPVQGYVVEVNEALLLEPELVNTYPYEMGWLVLLQPISLARNLKNLLYGTKAFRWFEVELERLRRLLTAACQKEVEQEVGRSLPDGGTLDFSILDDLPPVKTKKLLLQFFSFSL
ncbi:MAG: glycine cleavage system protein H [Deltaproteobacteria bacterium]